MTHSIREANQKLKAMLESFIAGENQSLAFSNEIEGLIATAYPEDSPLQELAEYLAQYRPGGGEFLYSESQAVLEINRWLRHLSAA